jgi:predicted Zn-dependent protease
MADRIKKLKVLLEQEPGDPFLLYSLAQDYAKAGDAANALAFFDRTIAADQDYCYAYYHKARVQQQSGDTAPAMTRRPNRRSASTSIRWGDASTCSGRPRDGGAALRAKVARRSAPCEPDRLQHSSNALPRGYP